MKVTKVLVSCDNESYAQMFPLVKEAWQRVCSYECIVVYVGNELPPILKKEQEKNNSSVFLFKPVEGVHSTFQTQCIRLLWPCLMENETVLISDMDIAPLSKGHFVDLLLDYSEDQFITYTDRYKKQKMFAMCYNVAHCKKWKEIFCVSNEDEIKEKLKNWYSSVNSYDGKKNCVGWYTDQIQLYNHVINREDVKILTDNETGFNRLDKKDKHELLGSLGLKKQEVQQGLYTDFHFIRPYKKFHKVMEILVRSAYN
jgi:hypothetical protein